MAKLLRKLKIINGEKEDTEEEEISEEEMKEQRKQNRKEKKRRKSITEKLKRPPEPIRHTLADIEQSWKWEKQERREKWRRTQCAGGKRRNSV